MPNISKFRKPIIIALLCFISILMYAQNGKTYKNLIFKSKILGKDIIYNIYLPPDYLDSKEIPALYNLHGFGGNHYSSEILTSVIDSLIVQKEFQKLIIVSPNADKTWYVDNWDESVLYSSMFIKEFIPFIKKTYNVSKSSKKTVVSGNSMGGFGALRFSMLYPDIFGVCVGFQSAIDTDYQFKSMLESDYKKFHEHIYGKKNTKEDYIDAFFYKNQPLYIAQKLSSDSLNKVKWYIQCCDNDYHSGPNAELHVLFRNKKINHEYRVSNGKHSRKCVEGSLQDALKFIKKSISENKN